MRRNLLAIAIVLSTGGWVCDSANTCPQGELQCSSDVAAHVCCPQGSPYRCGDHCSPTQECSDFTVCTYPDDPGSGLCTAGAYVAVIRQVVCTAPTQPGGPYQISVDGTLAGCGETPVSIRQAPDDLSINSADCGTWSIDRPVTGIVCAPPKLGFASTEWQIRSTAGIIPPNTLPQVSVTLTLELEEQPVIAQATQPCPPP